MDNFQNVLIIIAFGTIILLGRAVIDVLKLDAIRHGVQPKEKKERKMWPFRRRNKLVEEIHVCQIPGVEMRMTLDGRTILQGDMASFHHAAKWGSGGGNEWYDLLNDGEKIQFRPQPGAVIGLEIRAIQTNGWGHGKDECHDAG